MRLRKGPWGKGGLGLRGSEGRATIPFAMLTKKQKGKSIAETQMHDEDTGSPEVQASILSKRIEELSRHLKKNPKDFHSRRGLIGMVARRQSMLGYLQKSHPKRYAAVVKKLGLKKKA
jgi:small subunit ribosomal protein S15